jgi:hypothetical protein
VRTAKNVAVALAAALLLGAGMTGDALLAVLGAAAFATVWAQADVAGRLDTASRFLAGHTASQLARPVSAVRRADESVAGLRGDARTSAAIVIDGAGLFVGAIGPRQVSSAAARTAARCGDVMVPAGRLRITRSDVAASDIAADLAVSGIVLVQGDGGIGAVEAEEVEVQRRAWAVDDSLALRLAHGSPR